MALPAILEASVHRTAVAIVAEVVGKAGHIGLVEQIADIELCGQALQFRRLRAEIIGQRRIEDRVAGYIEARRAWGEGVRRISADRLSYIAYTATDLHALQGAAVKRIVSPKRCGQIGNADGIVPDISAEALHDLGLGVGEGARDVDVVGHGGPRFELKAARALLATLVARDRVEGGHDIVLSDVEIGQREQAVETRRLILDPDFELFRRRRLEGGAFCVRSAYRQEGAGVARIRRNAVVEIVDQTDLAAERAVVLCLAATVQIVFRRRPNSVIAAAKTIVQLSRAIWSCK